MQLLSEAASCVMCIRMCSGGSISMLQMWLLQGRGGSDLNAAIKKYRQSIFKLNYKLKKSKTTPSARHKIAVPLNAAERILADQS